MFRKLLIEKIKNQNVRAINERLALTILGAELAEDYNLDNLVCLKRDILNVDTAKDFSRCNFNLTSYQC